MHEHELRCTQSVNRSYASVKEVLDSDTLALFQRATMAAATGSGGHFARLSVALAGHQLERDVRVEITGVDRSGRPPSAMALPATALSFAWHAASEPALFPSMRAELTVYGLSQDKTQLDLHGWYRPPAGVFGAAVDALGGHRLAEASVCRFLDDVARRLEQTGTSG